MVTLDDLKKFNDDTESFDAHCNCPSAQAFVYKTKVRIVMCQFMLSLKPLRLLEADTVFKAAKKSMRKADRLQCEWEAA